MLQSYKGKGMGGQTKIAKKALKLHEGISDQELKKLHRELDKKSRREFDLKQKEKKEALKFYKSLQV